MRRSIRSTQRVLLYAPRTARCTRVVRSRKRWRRGPGDVSDDDLRSITPRVPRSYAPRNPEDQAIKGGPKQLLFFCKILILSSLFASICVPIIPRSPGIIPEPRSEIRSPENPEERYSRAEALPARSRFLWRSSRSTERRYFYKP